MIDPRVSVQIPKTTSLRWRTHQRARRGNIVFFSSEFGAREARTESLSP
jgi:hypothetical protein